MTSPAPALPRPVAALIVLLFLAMLVRTAWLSDDALITLRTVLNVAHGFGARFNVAERVQTFTHPLWAMLLTAGYVVIRNVYATAFVLSIGTSVVVLWLALTRAVSTWQSVAVAVMLLGSHAFVDYSTSGLENPLCALLLAAFAGMWVRASARPDDGRALTLLATLTSLLYLSRPDAVLIVLPLLAVACARTTWRRAVAALAIGALPAAGWTMFSLVYYGFPFPNTAYAKLGMSIPRQELVRQGLLYLIDSFDRDPLTLTAIAFALVLAAARRGNGRRALAIGIALYLVYIVSIGGDFMAGRFLMLPLCAAALLIARFVTGPRAVWIGVSALFAFVAAMSSHVTAWSDSRFDDASPHASGIVDERGVYFKNQSLVKATRDTFHDPDWPSDGVIPDRLNVVRACGLLGASGLDMGAYTHLLDECALADPLLARLPAIFNPGWRTGHYRRMVPDGYEESLATGRNLVTDPLLHGYYEDIRTITRAPIWSRERWRAIRRVNGGRDDALVNRAFYRHGGALLSLDRMTTLTPNETPWDGAGTHATMPLAIACDDRRGRRHLDIAVTAEDSFKLYFLKRDETVSVLELGPVPPHRRRPGLEAYTLDVPPRAASDGFDTIVVMPTSNGPHPSVGHVLLEGYPPTEAELARRVHDRDEAFKNR